MYNEGTAHRVTRYARCGERLFPLTATCCESDNERPMIEIRYAAFCDHALVDRSGKLSIIGIFDAIRPPQLPFNMPTFYLVVGFEAASDEAQQFDAKYLVMGEDGASLFERETSLSFPDVELGQMKRYNDVMQLTGMPVTSPGPHSFTVYVNNEIRKRVVLDVLSPPGVQT